MSEMQEGRMLHGTTVPTTPRSGIEESLEALDRKNSGLVEVVNLLEEKLAPFLRNDVDDSEGVKDPGGPMHRPESDHQQAINDQRDRLQISINRLSRLLERFDR